jgi:hypothetical protein
LLRLHSIRQGEPATKKGLPFRIYLVIAIQHILCSLSGELRLFRSAPISIRRECLTRAKILSMGVTTNETRYCHEQPKDLNCK